MPQIAEYPTETSTTGYKIVAQTVKDAPVKSFSLEELGSLLSRDSSASVSNWSEFTTAIANAAITDVILTGTITVPTGVTAEIPVSQSLHSWGGLFDFSSDTGQVEINGPIFVPYNTQIFSNCIALPLSPVWDQGGGVATLSRPSVYGDSSSVRHLGWWGLYNGVNVSDCLQYAVDSGARVATNGRIIGSKVEIPNGSYEFDHAVQMTYRFNTLIIGQGAWKTELIASSTNGFSDAAMFIDEAPSASTWSFAIKYRDFTFRTYGDTGINFLNIDVMGEGSELSGLQGTANCKFVNIIYNGIGGRIFDTHIGTPTSGGHDLYANGAAFLYCNGNQTRVSVEDCTYNPNGIQGTYPKHGIRFRGGRLTFRNLHIESCWTAIYGITIAADTVPVGFSQAKPCWPVNIVGDGLDMHAWPTPIPGDADVFKHQVSYVALESFDYSQVDIRAVRCEVTYPYQPEADNDYFLMDAENPGTKVGEIPVTTPYGGDGSIAMLNIKHNMVALGQRDLPFGTALVDIPGTTPSKDHMRHLYMPNEYEVHINYPEDITAAGLAHQDVIEAALAMLGGYPIPAPTADTQQDGTVYFKVGNYELSNELLVQARLNFIGASKCVYSGFGTDFIVIAGGDLENDASKYAIRVVSSKDRDNVNYNANFSQHTRDFRVLCNSYCSGVQWGGAQMSSLENVQVRDVHTAGKCFWIRESCNGARVTDCHAGAIYAGDPLGTTTIGFDCDRYSKVLFTNCKTEWCDIGWVLKSGNYRGIGCHSEACRVPVQSQDPTEGVHDFELTIYDNKIDPGISKRIMFNIPSGHKHASIRGMIHGSSGSCGYVYNGDYVEYTADGANGNGQYFSINTEEAYNGYYKVATDDALAAAITAGATRITPVGTVTLGSTKRIIPETCAIDASIEGGYFDCDNYADVLEVNGMVMDYGRQIFRNCKPASGKLPAAYNTSTLDPLDVVFGEGGYYRTQTTEWLEAYDAGINEIMRRAGTGGEPTWVYYKCIQAHTTSAGIPITDTNYWELSKVTETNIPTYPSVHGSWGGRPVHACWFGLGDGLPDLDGDATERKFQAAVDAGHATGVTPQLQFELRLDNLSVTLNGPIYMAYRWTRIVGAGRNATQLKWSHPTSGTIWNGLPAADWPVGFYLTFNSTYIGSGTWTAGFQKGIESMSAGINSDCAKEHVLFYAAYKGRLEELSYIRDITMTGFATSGFYYNETNLHVLENCDLIDSHYSTFNASVGMANRHVVHRASSAGRFIMRDIFVNGRAGIALRLDGGETSVENFKVEGPLIGVQMTGVARLYLQNMVCRNNIGRGATKYQEGHEDFIGVEHEDYDADLVECPMGIYIPSSNNSVGLTAHHLDVGINGADAPYIIYSDPNVAAVDPDLYVKVLGDSNNAPTGHNINIEISSTKSRVVHKITRNKSSNVTNPTAWSQPITYNVGDYVTVSGVGYFECIIGHDSTVADEPGAPLATGWPLYWKKLPWWGHECRQADRTTTGTETANVTAGAGAEGTKIQWVYDAGF